MNGGEFWRSKHIDEATGAPLTAEKFAEWVEQFKARNIDVVYETVEFIPASELRRRQRGEKPIRGYYDRVPRRNTGASGPPPPADPGRS